MSLEDLVPQDHILRVIDQSIDFSFIYDLVKELSHLMQEILRPVSIRSPYSKSFFSSTFLALEACVRPSKKLK